MPMLRAASPLFVASLFGCSAASPSPVTGTLPPPSATAAAAVERKPVNYRIGQAAFTLGAVAQEIAFSSDGKRVAACTDGLGLRIWSVPDGKELARANPFYKCTALTWMPGDERLIVAGLASFESSVAPVVSIDTSTGRVTGRTGIEGRNNVNELVPIDGQNVAIGNTGYSIWHIDADAPPLTKIDWKKAWRTLKSKSYLLRALDDSSTITVESATGASLCKTPWKGLRDRPLALSPDETSFAVLNSDEVTTYALPSCKELARAKIRARGAHYDVSGTLWVFTANDDKEAVSRLAAGAVQSTISIPSRVHTPLDTHDLSRDGRYLALPTQVGIRVVDLKSPQTGSELRHDTPIHALAFAGAHDLIATSDDATIRYQDDGSKGALLTVDGPVPASFNAIEHGPSDGDVAIRADGTALGFITIVSAGQYFHRNLSLLDLEHGKTITHERVEGGFCAFWRDSLLHAQGKHSAIFQLTSDGKWDELPALAQTEVRGIATDRAGTYFALRAWDGFTLCTASSCAVIEREKHEQLVSLSLGTARLFAIYSKFRQVAAPQLSLYGYELSAHAPHSPITIPKELTEDPPCVVDVGPTDDLIAMGFPDGRVQVLDSAFHVISTFEAHAPVSALAWSQDGKRLASGHTNGTGFVWVR
jgi:WD40 repeat protein